MVCFPSNLSSSESSPSSWCCGLHPWRHWTVLVCVTFLVQPSPVWHSPVQYPSNQMKVHLICYGNSCYAMEPARPPYRHFLVYAQLNQSRSSSSSSSSSPNSGAGGGLPFRLWKHGRQECISERGNAYRKWDKLAFYLHFKSREGLSHTIFVYSNKAITRQF